MKLLAGFTLTCLGLDRYLRFLFNLLFVQESLVPVHFCHPQYCFYFSFIFMSLLPLKRSILVSPEPAGQGVCQH